MLIFPSSDIITVVNFEDRLFTVVVTCKRPIFVKKKKKKKKEGKYINEIPPFLGEQIKYKPKVSEGGGGGMFCIVSLHFCWLS